MRCFMKKIAIPFCILCLALLVGLTACNNQNDSGQTYYLPYEIDNTGCIKRFYANETNSVNITIPATYSIDEEGKIIAGKAYEVKTIGNHCFANNNLIKSVQIPKSIETIEDYAFYNCANISTINITSNIVSIGKDAFELCPQLKTITNNGKSGLVIDTNNNLTSFIIPSSITKIENNAFSNWGALATISIEDINYIGDNAFSNCQNLYRVSIDSCLSYLGSNAFANCEKLTSLTNKTSNDPGIYFAPKQQLNSFVVPLSVTSIQKEFFYGWEQLKEVEIHGAISSLDMIFKDNKCLTKLTCGSNNVLSLFYHYTKYETSATDSTITETGGDNFYVVKHKPNSGSYVYYYLIPNNLTEVHLLNDIESYCFYNMTSLKKVYLPNDITTFGQGAFAGCSGLTNVYFSTDSDWKYEISYYTTTDTGIVSKSDMNNSITLANQLKAHNGYDCYWKKV